MINLNNLNKTLFKSYIGTLSLIFRSRGEKPSPRCPWRWVYTLTTETHGFRPITSYTRGNGISISETSVSLTQGRMSVKSAHRHVTLGGLSSSRSKVSIWYLSQYGSNINNQLYFFARIIFFEIIQNIACFSFSEQKSCKYLYLYA